MDNERIRLTTMCACAGCAAKIRATDLEKLLKGIAAPPDSRVLAGQASADDAVVVQVAPGVAIVQTVDFFPPVVDDPYRFGRVAAANSLSDVYAMGGTPLTAMNITCFPTKTVGTEVLGEILRGGLEKILEAGAIMAGGHTIEDPEPKYGLSVTGTIDPARMVRKDGARVGDVLVLTKPLGTGIMNTAHKHGDITAEELEAVLVSMETLNRAASLAMLKAGAQGGTDVTGYSLLGHSLEMCRAGGVAMEFSASALPLLPGVLDAYRRGHYSGGSKANLAYVKPFVAADPGVSEDMLALMADAQTSGGLLISLPEEAAKAMLPEIAPLGEAPRIIGRVVKAEAGKALLTVHP